MSLTSVISPSPVQVGVGFDNPFNQFAASFASPFRSKNVRSIDISTTGVSTVESCPSHGGVRCASGGGLPTQELQHLHAPPPYRAVQSRAILFVVFAGSVLLSMSAPVP